MFKDKKFLALLLFIIIIAFSILSEYNILETMKMKMPLQKTKENFDDTVPSCDYGVDVPACYSTIVDEDTLYNYNYYDDNYILKTEVVPPVCPACPSLINGHSHEENVGESTSILGTDQATSDGDINVVSQEQTTSVEENTNTNTSNTSNTSNVTNIYNPESNNENQNQNSTSNQGQVSMPSMPSLSSGSSTEEYQKEIERLKSELNKLKQNNGGSSDSCPPCPPCDRCPEPSFSCEKVLNYRSPNVGNYLPLPVLNDFSTFDNQ